MPQRDTLNWGLLGERRLRNYRAICPRFAIVANISGRNSTADRLTIKFLENLSTDLNSGIYQWRYYYAHRYVSLAINCLPEAEQANERKRLNKVLMRTRDQDGTWNDRVFPRSRAYGTAMSVLALLGEKVPTPPKVANANADRLIPDLEFIYLADKQVTLDQTTIDLAKFDEWLGEEKFSAEPFTVIIHAIGDSRTGDVEIIKRAISKKFPECKLYIAIPN